MLKRNANRILFVVLALLILIFWISKQYDQRNSSNFRKELFQIDTAQVTAVLIKTPEADSPIELTKNGAGWLVSQGAAQFPVDEAAVNGLLEQLPVAKVKRLAATTKEKWADLQVDEQTGKQVTVMSGEKVLADFVVGKLSFSQTTRQGLSYLRLQEENQVYAVESFLAATLRPDLNSWRNKRVTFFEVDDVQRLQFTYPADSSFVLEKGPTGQWQMESEAADSTAVMAYLSKIAKTSETNFAEQTPSSAAFATLVITRNNHPPIQIQAYQGSTPAQVILHSSQNEQAYFKSPMAKDIYQRIFVGKPNFLSE